MTYDTNSVTAAARALREAEMGGGSEVRGQAVTAPAAAREARNLAFQTQLAAIQQVVEPSGGDESNRRFAVDPGLVNDPLMLDALRTIARLSREAGLEQGVGHVHGHHVSLDTGDVGGLSARFESGSDGIEAIGYDRVGGTSYGKYQLSSKAGTMDRFLSFLKDHEPQWASRLRHAGPADTGSSDGRMPRVWRQIAREDPERFEALQHDFVRNEHYLPARDKILGATGVDIDAGPEALREVLWSTSVQHGASGAARIFNKVIAEVLDKSGNAEDRHIIDKVYADRQKQFASSTDAVRRSVRDRLREERSLALAMLDEQQVRRIV